jgi:hypothetical protein
MKDDRFWEEGVNQLRHPRPCDPILLEDGGLMSYGVELRESFRRSAGSGQHPNLPHCISDGRFSATSGHQQLNQNRAILERRRHQLTRAI